jgi:hypothetical protein
MEARVSDVKILRKSLGEERRGLCAGLLNCGEECAGEIEVDCEVDDADSNCESSGWAFMLE